MPPSLGSIFCYNVSLNPGKHLLFTVFYKDITKDTNEQLDEEVHRTKSKSPDSGPSTGVSVPMELGCTMLPACGCVHQPESPSNLVVQEFL